LSQIRLRFRSLSTAPVSQLSHSYCEPTGPENVMLICPPLPAPGRADADDRVRGSCRRSSWRCGRDGDVVVGVVAGEIMLGLDQGAVVVALAGGLSVKAVAQLLGHANPNITPRTYARLWPDDEDRSREAVDAVVRRPDVPTMCPRPAA
jgi:hypothetical protein